MTMHKKNRLLLLSSGHKRARLFPFTDLFDRSNGDLGNGWEYTAGKWTIAGNAAKGNPALGSELVANGAFDADSDWVKGGANWTIADGKATYAPGDAKNLTQNVLTVGAWIRSSFDVVRFTAGQGFKVLHGSNNMGTARTTAATFTEVMRAVGDGQAGFRGFTLVDGDIDNVSFKQITLADMLCTRNTGVSSLDLYSQITLTAGLPAGLALCLDSKTSPANFLLAYHNGVNAKLVKCLAGVYTELISAAAAYAAGRVLRVVKSVNNVSLYYNGAQIGATQDITGDAYATYNRHGLFTTSNLNTFASIQAVAV